MFEEAVEKLEASVAIEMTALRYDLLAQCRSELGLFEEALLDATRATSLDPQVWSLVDGTCGLFARARVFSSMYQPGALPHGNCSTKRD